MTRRAKDFIESIQCQFPAVRSVEHYLVEAELLHEEGLSGDAIEHLDSAPIPEAFKDPQCSPYRRVYWRIQVAAAAKSKDWSTGLAAWEQWAEMEILDSFLSKKPALGFRDFFIAYAESLQASGDTTGAVRYAKKALRMNLDGDPEVAKRAAAVIGKG